MAVVPAGVVSRKRERDWENEMDAVRRPGFELDSSERLCQDLDLGDLDVQEEVGAEPFEEELISNVMRSLEQEIQAHPASPSYYGSSVLNNTAEEGGGGGGRSYVVDIEYLLEATDNELGIPPSPGTGLQQLTRQEELDSLFENGTEDLLQLCLYSNAHPQVEIEEESVGFLNEGGYYEDWMPRHMSGGLFEAPFL